MNKFTIICAALLLLSPLPAAADMQLLQLDRKTRKQLEKENLQLRQRLESMQQELEWLKTDAHERDSLRQQQKSRRTGGGVKGAGEDQGREMTSSTTAFGGGPPSPKGEGSQKVDQSESLPLQGKVARSAG